jgi:hypothetical protein
MNLLLWQDVRYQLPNLGWGNVLKLHSHLNVTINLLNKQLQTAEMLWSSRFGVLPTCYHNIPLRSTELHGLEAAVK